MTAGAVAAMTAGAGLGHDGVWLGHGGVFGHTWLGSAPGRGTMPAYDGADAGYHTSPCISGARYWVTTLSLRPPAQRQRTMPDLSTR